jgi:hypothetical protein
MEKGEENNSGDHQQGSSYMKKHCRKQRVQGLQECVLESETLGFMFL